MKNTKNVTVVLGAFLMGLALFTLNEVAQAAEGARPAKVTKAAKATQPAKATKAEEKDANGCVLADGYMYSVVLEKCIRPSEEGVAMNSVEEGKNLTDKAFVVRNPKEKAAEVFLPGKKKSLVMGMNVFAKVPTWAFEDMVLVNDPKEGWKLSQGEKVLFVGKAR